jgi:hypothetical protein
MTLHLSQIGFTEALTFILDPPFQALLSAHSRRLFPSSQDFALLYGVSPYLSM